VTGVSSAALAAAFAATRVVADPRWSPDGSRLAWVEQIAAGREATGVPCGGFALREIRSTGVSAGDLIPTARARADGGGRWCFTPGGGLRVLDPSGSLWSAAGSRVLVDAGSVVAVAAGPDGRCAFAWERLDALDVMELALEDTDALTRCSSADFAWDPCWSATGMLAWHEWDLPAMPWDASRIVVRGTDNASRVVAGGNGVAVGQPRFSPDGSRLAYVSDATGWANVWVADHDGAHARPLLDEPHEHAEPSWGAGQRSYAWSPDGREIALVRNEDGFARLLVVAVDGEAGPRELAKGWHHGLDWGPQGIVAVRSGARTPPQVTVIDPRTDDRRVVARGAPPGIEDDAVEPDVVTWPSGDVTVPGLLYRTSSSARGDGLPPLLVDVHGGPTGQATVTWESRTALFTAQGWSVLRPQYRGSSGYGRAYRRALEHGWGEAEVADVVAGIRVAGERGWCAPGRVAVVGASAGGMTALLVAERHPELLGACVAWYPVTDLADLARSTHRFESRYTDGLVGELPGDAARFVDRSPVTHAAQLRVPTLLLQGEDDPVVRPQQARTFVTAVRAGGNSIEAVRYPGEGHGWSSPATVEDALARTFAFCHEHVVGKGAAA